MARTVTVNLVDDIDGVTPADETVHFSFDGSEFVIDLCESNAAELREQLEEWISHARRVSGRARKRGTGLNAAAAAGPIPTVEIREWARKNGYGVASRGRIPADVVEAYQSRIAG
ncbi:histone-like nucleoid-structuring protein Lsr2 [Smaragdicoccus niigatensis]|uniref:histone-like nucleoid-structuring protein Lsr2 n=1 Tax=Smaragdicoccus niigatensis TaxID=359359 RepID=UPI00037324D6|nr:Lsr2 family protein [Smaragdicoccus niigatensis]